MATKKFFIGSQGPFLYDDQSNYGDGQGFAAFYAPGQVIVVGNIATDNLSTNVRIAFSNADKEVQEVNDLTAWIGGDSGIEVDDDGDGTVTVRNVADDDNDFVTGVSFNTSDGVLTITVANQNNPTVDLDGRYSREGAGHEASSLELTPIAEPSAPASGGIMYIDSADDDLKVKFANGTVVTIASN